MNKRLIITAALLLSCHSYAEQLGQIGQACTQVGQTIMSSVQQEGIVACLPDGNGNLYWQPENGGMARYDGTAACNVAGTLRWNGSGIQYCDGANWQNIGGGMTIIEGGCQTYWSGCPAGYTPTSYFSPGTYNCCDKCGNPAWRYTVCSQ